MVEDQATPASSNNNDRVNIEKDNFRKILEKVKQYDSEWLKQTLGDSLIDMLVKDSETTSSEQQKDDEGDDRDRSVDTYSVETKNIIEPSPSTLSQAQSQSPISQQPIIETYITDISNAGDAIAVMDISAEKRIIEQIMKDRQGEVQSTSSSSSLQQQPQFSPTLTTASVDTGSTTESVVSNSIDVTEPADLPSTPFISSLKTSTTPTNTFSADQSPVVTPITAPVPATSGDMNFKSTTPPSSSPPLPPSSSPPKKANINNSDLLLFNRLIELGYNKNEIFAMKASVKKIVVDRSVKRPRKGLPTEWLEPVKPTTATSSDNNSKRRSRDENDDDTRRSRSQVSSSSSSSSSNRDRSSSTVGKQSNQSRLNRPNYEKKNNDDLYDDDNDDDEFGGFTSNNRKRNRKSNVASSSTSSSTSTSSSSSNSNTAEGSNLFWPDKEEFKDLILEESRWRASLVGDFWLPSIKQEAKWRYFMYKKWKEFLDQGVSYGFDSVDMPTFENQNNRDDGSYDDDDDDDDVYDDEENEDDDDDDDDEAKSYNENEQRYTEYLKYKQEKNYNMNNDRQCNINDVNEMNDYSSVRSDSKYSASIKKKASDNIYTSTAPKSTFSTTATTTSTIKAVDNIDDIISPGLDITTSVNSNDNTSSSSSSSSVSRTPPIPVTVIPLSTTASAISATATAGRESNNPIPIRDRDVYINDDNNSNNSNNDNDNGDYYDREYDRNSDNRRNQRSGRGDSGTTSSSSSNRPVPTATGSMNRNSVNNDSNNIRNDGYDDSNMKRKRRKVTSNNSNNNSNNNNNNNSNNSRRSSYSNNNNNNNKNNNNRDNIDDVRMNRDLQRERAYDDWLKRTLSEQDGWTDLSVEQRNIIQNRKKAKFLEKEYKKRTENQLTDKMDWFSDLDRNNRNPNRYDDEEEYDDDDDFIFDDDDDEHDDDDEDYNDRNRNNYNMAMNADRRRVNNNDRYISADGNQRYQPLQRELVSDVESRNLRSSGNSGSRTSSVENDRFRRGRNDDVEIRYDIPSSSSSSSSSSPFQPSPVAIQRNRRLDYDDDDDDDDDFGSKTNFKWNTPSSSSSSSKAARGGGEGGSISRQRLTPLQQQRQAVMNTVATNSNIGRDSGNFDSRNTRNSNDKYNNKNYDDDDDDEEEDNEVSRQMIRSVTQLAEEEEAFRIAWEASATRKPIL